MQRLWRSWDSLQQRSIRSLARKTPSSAIQLVKDPPGLMPAAPGRKGVSANPAANPSRPVAIEPLNRCGKPNRLPDRPASVKPNCRTFHTRRSSTRSTAALLCYHINSAEGTTLPGTCPNWETAQHRPRRAYQSGSRVWRSPLAVGDFYFAAARQRGQALGKNLVAAAATHARDALDRQPRPPCRYKFSPTYIGASTRQARKFLPDPNATSTAGWRSVG